MQELNAASWTESVYGISSSKLILFGTPVLLAASCAGYYYWKLPKKASTSPQKKPRVRNISFGIWEEAFGVMRVHPDSELGCEEAKTVFVTLKGSRLEIYEANEDVPRREMFDEENPELTFKCRNTFNIFDCKIHLLPRYLDEKCKWHIRHPIEIQLKSEALFETLRFDKGNSNPGQTLFSDDQPSILLFARSNRDKEAWTRRLLLAIQNSNFPSVVEDPILSIRSARPLVEPKPCYIERKTRSIWLNSLVERFIMDEKIQDLISNNLTKQVQYILDNFDTPNQMDSIIETSVFKVDLDSMSVPKVTGVAPRYENEYGLWEEVSVQFDGQIKIILKVKLKPCGEHVAGQAPTSLWVNRLRSLAQYSFVKKMMESSTFFLEIDLDFLKGVLALNMPHPPTDCAWAGFRSDTKIVVSSRVLLGSWQLPFMSKITNVFKEYSLLNFYKNLVIPNMVQINFVDLMQAMKTK